VSPAQRGATVVGRGAIDRLSARDVAAGVTCSVTATSRGGRLTVAARPVRPTTT
jgi:hypothetical protein